MLKEIQKKSFIQKVIIINVKSSSNEKTQIKQNLKIEENRQFKQKFKPCIKYSNHS